MKAIAVIDHSVNGLFIYDVKEDWEEDKIQSFIIKQGRHLSNCSWGEFDGSITDLRGE